jgi:hypothetical protein
LVILLSLLDFALSISFHTQQTSITNLRGTSLLQFELCRNSIIFSPYVFAGSTLEEYLLPFRGFTTKLSALDISSN